MSTMVTGKQAAKRAPLSVSFPDDLRAELVRLAAENDRSVSGELRIAARAHLERERGAAA